MIAPSICAIFFVSLCWLSMGIQAKEKDPGRKMKFILLGTELKSNGEYLDYFGLAPGETQIILINSTKVVKALFMDSRIDNEDTKRTVYNVKSFPICTFLNNRLISKLYSSFYEEFVGNSTVFKCPLQPGTYYLKNSVGSHVVPGFHPSGTFRLTVNMKPEQKGPIIVELIWRYKVMRT